MTRLHTGLLVGPSAAMLLAAAGMIAVDQLAPRLHRLLERAGQAIEAGSVMW